jgi:hypothetical protein
VGTGLVHKTDVETYGVKAAPTGDVVGTSDSQTLSAKTLTTPTIADFTNAGHDHSNAAGGGALAAKCRTRPFVFQFPETESDEDRVFIITGFPYAATLVQVHAVCLDGTHAVFSLVTRSRDTPWTAAGQTVNVDEQEATTTGGTKTIASAVLAQNTQMFAIVSELSGTLSDLIISGHYTID